MTLFMMDCFLKYFIILDCELIQRSIIYGGLFKKHFYLFIYFWLHWVSIAALGLSLVVVSGGLFAVHRLLIVLASLVVEHGLQVLGVQ